MTERWPKQGAIFPPELEQSYEEFAVAREEFLIDYGYNTARAYWADLDDILYWCARHGKDPLRLTQQEFRQYQTLLKRQGYSRSTIRRRRTSYTGLLGHYLQDFARK